MSNRFHNKFHRYNHHSTKLTAYGDSGYDPIASKDAPFLGEFVVSSGYISAIDPDGDFSIYTDNLSADLINNRTLQTESITAETLVVTSVNLLYELSGMEIQGADFSDNVPAVIPTTNILKLSGVGFDTKTWANFQKDVAIGGDLGIGGDLTANKANFTDVSANTLSSQSLSTTDIFGVQSILPEDGKTIAIGRCSSTEMFVHTMKVSSLEGFTVNGIQIMLHDGWGEIANTSLAPEFENYQEIIYNSAVVAGYSDTVEHFLVMNVSAHGYKSYGELEIYATDGGPDVKLGGLKIGNPGLVPNYQLEHGEKSNLIINNEQTLSLMVPPSCGFKIVTLSGFYDGVNTDSNIQIHATVFERQYKELTFQKEDFVIGQLAVSGSLSASDIYSPLISASAIWFSPTVTISSLSANGDCTLLEFEINGQKRQITLDTP